MKKQLQFVFLILLLILTQNDVYSFNKAVQVLVKGTIIDEYTGKPVEAQLEFRDQNGRKIKTKSNSIDGSWEQIFNAGDQLEVILSNWNVARKIDRLVVKDTNAFFEQKTDYAVRLFEVGKPIYKLNIYEPQTAKFKENHNMILDSLKDVLLFARNIKVELRTNSHDSYAKIKTLVPVEKPIKKKKKKKNEPDVQPEPQIIFKNPDAGVVSALVETRVTELEAYIRNWVRFSDRIKVAGDFSILEEKDNSSLDINFDYEVVVTELKNTLEK